MDKIIARQQHYIMADVTVYPESNILIIDGKEQEIATKTMEVLHLLLRKYPHKVSGKDLVTYVWGDLPGAEQLLDDVISNLRFHLHDPRYDARYLATEENGDHRLIAPVSRVAQTSAGPNPLQQLLANRPLTLAIVAAVLILLLVMLQPSTPKMPLSSQSRSPFETVMYDDGAPSIAADGQFVVFSRFDKASSDLYIRRLAQNQSSELVADREVNEFSPAVSNDGRSLAYFAVAGMKCELMLLELASGNRQKLSHCSPETNSWTSLEFSANDKNLLTSQFNHRTGKFEVVEYNLKKAKITRRLSPQGGDQSYSKPSYSPDGDAVAFVVYDATTRDWQIQLSDWSAKPKRLFSSEHHIHDIKWQGNGVYYSLLNASNQSGVWFYDIVENKSTQLTANQAGSFDVSIDGSMLVSSEGSSTVNVWQLQLTADSIGEKVRISANRQSNQGAKSAPEGRFISYVSERDGYSNLWLTENDEKSAVMLTRFTGGTITDHHWSADGQWILLTHFDQGRYQTYRQQLAPGVNMPILTGEHNTRLAVPSQDGKSVIFSTQVGDQWQLVVQNLDLGVNKVLYPGAVSGLSITPDDVLYYQPEGSMELIKQPLTGEPVSLGVLPELASFESWQWTVKSPFLYVLANDEQGWVLSKRHLTDMREVGHWRLSQAIKPNSSFDIVEPRQTLLLSVLEELSTDLYLYRLER